MCLSAVIRRPGTSRTLLSGSGLEPGHQSGGHPPAVLDLDALRPGPLADLGAIHPAPRRPAPRPGRPPGTAPGPPRRPHIARQRIPQRLSVLSVQVDLILGAIQPEADSALSLAAIEVVDEQGLYLLHHRCFLSSLTSSARSAKGSRAQLLRNVVSAHKSAHRPSHQAGDHVPIRLLPQAAAEAGEPPGTWGVRAPSGWDWLKVGRLSGSRTTCCSGERKGPDGRELAPASANDGKAGQVLRGRACG